MFAEDEATLLLSEASDLITLRDMITRRMTGVPLEYIVGWAEFCGLRIAVAPGVFVPRRRTQFLVTLAALRAGSGDVVVDLCCGTGAVGIAIAAAVGPLDLYAVDIDAAAVRCARRNVTNGRVCRGDLFSALPPALRGRVDVVAANVPYVPSSAIGLMPPEARDHEPLATRDGGTDGLDVLRAVSIEASRWLAPGGYLLMEISADQAAEAAAAVTGGGLIASVHHCDELDATVVEGEAQHGADRQA